MDQGLIMLLILVVGSVFPVVFTAEPDSLDLSLAWDLLQEILPGQPSLPSSRYQGYEPFPEYSSPGSGLSPDLLALASDLGLGSSFSDDSTDYQTSNYGGHSGTHANYGQLPQSGANYELLPQQGANYGLPRQESRRQDSRYVSGIEGREHSGSSSYQYHQQNSQFGYHQSQPSYRPPQPTYPPPTRYSPPKYKAPRRKVYVPVKVKKAKKKMKVISIQKGFYIPGGTQLFGKYKSLKECEKACAATPNCFAGDYNPWVNKCYIHSNFTACGTLKAHKKLFHFKKIPCAFTEAPNGRIVLGAQLFKGLEQKKIKSLSDCLKKCASAGIGIPASIDNINQQVCFGIDYDFSTHKCFFHVDNLFAPGAARICDLTGLPTPVPRDTVPNPSVIGIYMCPGP